MFIDPLSSGMVFLPLQFSRNPLEYVIDPADTSIANRSGLRYFLELLVPDSPGSSQFTRLVKMPGSEKPPTTSSGSNVFEGAFYQIADLLDGFLAYQKPEAGAVDMCILSTLTMPYQAVESVTNNGQELAGTTKKGASQWVLKGGLTERDFVAWNGSFFTAYMSEKRPFLTWQPNGKTISRSQEEYLFFLLNMQPMPSTVVRRVRITYQDGRRETVDKGQLTGGQPYQVVCLPAGPKALGLTSDVASYEVWLSDNTASRNRLSEVRLYQLDTRPRSQQRYVLFSNSLGGWDTLRLVGEGMETLNTTRTTATLERPAGAPADFAELRVVNLEGSRTITASTGWFESHARHQLRYLAELLLSSQLYLVDEKGHQPLELITASLVDKEDNPDLVARTFVFRVSTPQTNHSAMPAAPMIAARPVKWRGVGVLRILDGYGKRTGKARPLKLQKYYPDTGAVYKPITEKPNQPGDPDFVDALPLPGEAAGSTPYPSQAISRATTYRRTTCTNGQVGDVATVTIPAGKYGSETSQADADGKAEAEYTASNTQAYADANGSCTAAPELYQVAVAAGCWRYRVSDGQRFEVEWFQQGNEAAKIGNTWDLQGQNRAYVYPRYSTDLEFPVKPSDWRFFVYGTAGQQIRLQLYQNGLLRIDRAVTMNPDGYEYLALTNELASTGNPLTSGDKLYFKATPI